MRWTMTMSREANPMGISHAVHKYGDSTALCGRTIDPHRAQSIKANPVACKKCSRIVARGDVKRKEQ